MKFRSMATITIAIVLLTAPLAVSAAAFAQPIIPSDCNNTGGCPTICTLVQVAQNILNTGIYVLVFLGAVLFFWAGSIAVTAGGSEQKWAKAKRIFSDVFIGLVIILLGYLVISTLMNALTGQSWWTSICKA